MIGLQATVSEIPSHYDIPSADAAVARRLTSVKYDRKKGLKTAEKKCNFMWEKW